MSKSSFIRKAAQIIALSAAMSGTFNEAPCASWGMANDLASTKPTHHGYYSKGHSRGNWEQKKVAYNHRVAKRRTKNKLAKKARRLQRGK